MKTNFGPRRYRLYPELARFASDTDRAAALETFDKALWRRRSFWLALLLLWLSTLALAEVVPLALPPALTGFFSGKNAIYFRSALLGLSLVPAIQFLWYRPRRQHLRRWLVDRGVPICLRCGYDLSGQVEPRCPECGEPCDSRLIPGSRPAQTSPCSSGSGKESG